MIEGNRERAWSARENGKREETRVGRRSGQRFGGAKFGKVSQADGRQRRKHLQSTSFCFQGLKASSSTKMLRDQEPTVLARNASSRQANAKLTLQLSFCDLAPKPADPSTAAGSNDAVFESGWLQISAIPSAHS